MGTLFEPTRKIWVFLEKARGFGSGEILDEQGEKVDGTKVCEVRQKVNAIQHIYEVKDDAGKILGRIKKAMTAIIKPRLRLETGCRLPPLWEQGWFAQLTHLLG